MKRALLLLLLVPVFAQAGTITIRSADAQKAESENAIVVSRIIVEGDAVVTYYNEVTEQVCTYAGSINGAAPNLTCVFRHELSGGARDKVNARAALRLN